MKMFWIILGIAGIGMAWGLYMVISAGLRIRKIERQMLEDLLSLLHLYL
jgi:hypothetical protein